MRQWSLLVGFVVFILTLPSVWAAYDTVPGKAFDVTELTGEIKVVVPELEGCEQSFTHLICRRMTGEFTPSERQAIDAAVVAHDATVRDKRKQQRQQDRQSARLKLKALGLTEAEVQALNSP